jgi:polar amino acid transport system substrate-binding protein
MTLASMHRRTLLVLLVLATACGLPRDPDDTLPRVRGGAMRVGFAVDTPWVTDSAGGAGGIEGEIMRDLARELGARIEWHPGPAPVLLDSLKKRELDLVVGGLTATSPYRTEVSLTKPYYTDTTMVHGERAEEEHVVAVSPGENAWQVEVEKVLRGKRNEFPQLRQRYR